MEEKREPESFMMRVARFIVNKRKAFIALFILACIYSVLSMSKVKVINDLTDYLPESTETRQGLDIMDEQFTTFGSAKIMVTNITYEKALQLAKEMENINGISAVDFYDASDDDYEDKEVTDYYQDASALYTLTFDEPEDTRLSQTAMEKVRDSLDGYSSYVYTTVDKDDAKSLQEDMKLIGVIVVFIDRDPADRIFSIDALKHRYELLVRKCFLRYECGRGSITAGHVCGLCDHFPAPFSGGAGALCSYRGNDGSFE